MSAGETSGTGSPPRPRADEVDATAAAGTLLRPARLPTSGRGPAWSGRVPRTHENAGSNPAVPTEETLSQRHAATVGAGVVDAGKRKGKPTGDGTRLLPGRATSLEGSTLSPSAA